jgi:hypothetical protein
MRRAGYVEEKERKLTTTIVGTTKGFLFLWGNFGD